MKTDAGKGRVRCIGGRMLETRMLENSPAR